jgi:hypothetical protein
MWNKYRVIAVIITIIFFILGWYFFDFILEPSESNKVSRLDIFSYIGTIFTISAFIIAILEILHNISITKSIKDETDKAIQNVLKLKHASKLSLCLSALDSINDHINNIEYVLALKDFRFIRTFVLEDEFLNKKLSIQINLFTNIEDLLIMHRKASVKAPMALDDVKVIRSFILTCKAALEKQAFNNDEVNKLPESITATTTSTS